eukprot:scaffold24174_cov61-Phaeocystis_antarctica.AAC.1
MATTTRTGRHSLLSAGVPSARCGRATRTTCPSTTSPASQTLLKGACLRRPSRRSAFSCAPHLQEVTSPTPKATLKQIWGQQRCVGSCMTSMRMIIASSALMACSLLSDVLVESLTTKEIRVSGFPTSFA